MAYPRNTRKIPRRGKVIDVRSDGAVKLFEKALVQGPLTLVYVKAKWCGACHKFNDEVWSSLTKLKNKSVNLASVDSEFLAKTSLAKTPPKFYPTLMLVGKDKKPATFQDEEGNPTNAMPRNSTLSEDKEALSNLVLNPTRNNVSSRSPVSQAPVRMNSPPRASVTMNNLAKSPYNKPSTLSIPKSMNRMNSVIPTSNPPDVGSDLVASQKRSQAPSGQLVPMPIQGGGLLDAIKQKTSSLRSVLQLRGLRTRRNRK